MSMLGLSALQLNNIVQDVGAQSNNWYVGKGANPDTYYTYEIRNEATNQGQPFTMTLYLKEFNETGNYWVAPTFVVDQGRVYNGTFHLSALDMTAIGSSEIPPEMQKYRGAYDTTLKWLAAFVPNPGQSLSAASWGKIASIGGPEIKPGGASTVTTPAGTFETTAITYYKGVNNYIYVDPNMPFPVKAETFADVTYGNAPIQYTYELQATGTGQPPQPEAMVEIPVPPLKLQTPRGTHFIQLLWEPVEIKAGNQTNFGVIFTDDRENIVPRVTFSVQIMDENRTVVEELRNQRALEGTSQFSHTFDTPGEKFIQITIETVTGQDLGMFVESATFRLIVT